jgi:pyruvate carboxylase subunit B
MSEDGTLYYAGNEGQWHEVVVLGETVRVDGRELAADISTLPGSDRQHLRLGGRSLALFARRVDDEWLVELEGRLFEVRVEDERTRHIRELAQHAMPTDGVRELRAPMPGLVVRIEVEEGQDVEEGDGLVVMEAMKMENELRADAAGRVVAIAVTAGQAVERDAVLLRLESR